MRKYFIPALIIIVIISFTMKRAVAQSIDSDLRWSAVSFDNLETNEHVPHSCSFETNTQRIKWIQKGGARVYEFQIVGKSGSWADVSQNGEVTYEVTFRGNQGTMRFVKNNGSIQIIINIVSEGKNTLPYQFNINSISTL